MRSKMMRSRHGNAVLDAALVLPILISLAFGTVEFGHYFYVKHSLQGAAREGSRAAIVSGAQWSNITDAVKSSMDTAGIPVANYTVTVQKNLTAINSGNFTTDLATGDPVSVTVQATWGTVGLRPLGLISSSKIVKGAAVMRKE